MMDAVLATIFDGGEQFVENTISFKKLRCYFIELNKTKHNALGQPLRMAAHASDWGDSLNQCSRGGQTGHDGDDVCGGSCVGPRRNFCTIPTVGNLQSGEFSFPKVFWTQIGVKLLSC